MIDRKVLKFWWLSLAVKLFLAAVMPLNPDEAYYWVWSKHLQLSYFDHPGMVAWLFSLGNLFSPLGHLERWPALFLGHGTYWLWLKIMAPYLNAQKQKWLLITFLLSPLLGFGSLIVTPDVPVVFFWSLSLWLFLRYLKSANPFLAVGLGLSLGLGFCAKYHIVLFVPIALAYLTYNKLWARIKIKGFFLVLIAGFIGCMPVLLWNWQNNFTSFTYQLNHGLSGGKWKPWWTIEYLSGQFLLLLPMGVYLLWLARKKSRTLNWLWFFGLGPLLFFFLTSFNASVEANWPVIAYPALLSIMVLAETRGRILTSINVLWGILGLILISHVLNPWLSSAPEKFNESWRYKSLAHLTQSYAPLYACSYQLSSVLWYNSETPVYKIYQSNRHDFFDTFPQAHPQQNTFYLLCEDGISWPQLLDENNFEKKSIKRIEPRFTIWEVKRK